ncbi:MAG: sigma-54 dependent transcriptional regulator [Candidatus Sumerlaeia bacterium]
MAEPAHILFIDDDKNFRKVMGYALREQGYEVTAAENGREGLAALQAGRPDLILCDLKMPEMDGLAFLRALGEQPGEPPPVIVLTAFGSIESAVEAMRAGAFDYVTKPVNRDALRLAIERALRHARLLAENRSLREQLSGGPARDRLIGSSPAMRRLRDTLARLCESDATVLLRGESGCGKELAARALHYDGPRAASGRFVVVNCAAIPAELLESEMFGHRRGSFTGAHEDKPGKFEVADKGTLFLDEVGDMPLALQAKLLRALEDGEIQRIGENQSRRVNVRVVAATNQPLEEAIRAGRFRQDLYYRLAVVPVQIPPLRERMEDLPALLRHLLARHGAPGVDVTEEALAALMRHSWPGNVRELDNVVQQICALHPDLRRLSPAELPPLGQAPPGGASGSAWLEPTAPIQIPPGGIEFDVLERRVLEAAWRQSGGNQTEGARLVGLPRQAFIYRLQKYGIIPGYGEKKRDEKKTAT